MQYLSLIAVLLLPILVASAPRAEPVVPEKLSPPEEDGIWLRPGKSPAEPIIGHKDGIQLALWPTRGPRGVIRVYAPYVGGGHMRSVINFIAIEPIVAGWRGYSELEDSKLDERRGLRMWLSNMECDGSTSLSPSAGKSGVEPPHSKVSDPARGRRGSIRVNGKPVETLSVYLHVEKFDNGAHPYIKVIFRADRPNEIGFRVYAHKDSTPMESCVLTATMGNYSRTRLLWLKDEVVDSRKVWPGYQGGDFVWTDDFPTAKIRREKDGTYIAAITPNETDLAAAEMPPGGWTFLGKVSTQYWRKYPDSPRTSPRVRVNGRAMYYGGGALIPGGVAYENFELIEPFKPGMELWFGVTLKTPYQMGWRGNG